MNLKNNPDLQTWFEHQEEALPENLANVLIEDCLKELKNSEETSKKLGLLCDDRFNGICIYEEGSRTFRYWLFQDYSNKDKVYIIQTLLSQIDGKAVLEFLDVETKEHKSLKDFIDGEKEDKDWKDEQTSNRKAIFYFWQKDKLENTPKTLDHLLYQEFTEALRIGKTFDEALEIITKIYLVQRYV